MRSFRFNFAFVGFCWLSFLAVSCSEWVLFAGKENFFHQEVVLGFILTVFVLFLCIALVRMRFCVATHGLIIKNSLFKLLDDDVSWRRFVSLKRFWLGVWVYSLDYTEPRGKRKGLFICFIKDQWKLLYDISLRVDSRIVQKEIQNILKKKFNDNSQLLHK